MFMGMKHYTTAVLTPRRGNLIQNLLIKDIILHLQRYSLYVRVPDENILQLQLDSIVHKASQYIKNL